jgi:predicted amino acid-binding ACT domain protein
MVEEDLQNEEQESEPEEEENTEELVTVFSTDHPGIIAVVRSILDEAGIQYLVKGDGLQTLFALGTVVFQVTPDNVEMARELLADVKESEPLTGESTPDDINDYTENLPEGYDDSADPENPEIK